MKKTSPLSESSPEPKPKLCSSLRLPASSSSSFTKPEPEPKPKPEPEIWFHDVLRADGTPFDPGEADFLKEFLRPAGARGRQKPE